MDDDRSSTLLARLGDEDDAHAWSEFVEAYAPLLLQAARSVVRDADEAGDAFVFACERLAEDRCARLRRFDPQGGARFTTWLRIVAVNLARDWRRHRHGRPRMLRAVRALSALHRAVFHARYAQGLTAAETHGLLSTGRLAADATGVQEAEADIERRLTWRHRLALATRPALAAPASVEALAGDGHELAGGEEHRPDADFLRRRRSAEVRRAVAALPAADRLLLRLRFDEELTLREVARAAGLKDAQTADRRLRAVLAHLRSTLEHGPARVAETAPDESV